MSDAELRMLRNQLQSIEAKLERQARITAQALGLATALAMVMSREFPAGRIHLEAALTEASLAAEGDPVTLALLRRVSEAMGPRG